MKFVIFLGSLTISYLCIRYSKWLVDSIGRAMFFEEHLGAGGTYTFWKLLGLAFLVFGFWYFFS